MTDSLNVRLDSTDARTEILNRIRAANTRAGVGGTERARNHHVPVHHATTPRTPSHSGNADAADSQHVSGELDSSSIIDLFDERTADYRAVVEQCQPHEVAGRVKEALSDASTIIVPAGLDDEWVAGIRQKIVADPGPAAALDRVDATVTSCAAAIAETGTIVLDHTAGQGRRALTLVPDAHVVIVRAGQIVPDVPAAFRMLAPSIAAGNALTWISGPSATSDIELERVEGVHGPRRLVVIIVRDEKLS